MNGCTDITRTSKRHNKTNATFINGCDYIETILRPICILRLHSRNNSLFKF